MYNSTTKQHGFSSINGDTSQETVLMLITQTADITLSPFAIRQLVTGAHIWLRSESGKHVKQGVGYDIFALLAKMSEYVATIAENGKPIDGYRISVNRDEVLQLRYWLEARMLECETMRDFENQQMEKFLSDNEGLLGNPEYEDVIERNKPRGKFNADSYITMKLLLIELREWLLGTAVPVEEQPSKYHKRHVVDTQD